MKRCVHNYSQKALLDFSRLDRNTLLHIELVSHIFNKSAPKRIVNFFSFKQLQWLNTILSSNAGDRLTQYKYAEVLNAIVSKQIKVFCSSTQDMNGTQRKVWISLGSIFYPQSVGYIHQCQHNKYRNNACLKLS